MKTGDRCYLSTRDGHEQIPARVTLASANGQSLMLEFEAVVALPNGSCYVGSMPVLRRDDGRYVELLGSHEIRLQEAQ